MIKKLLCYGFLAISLCVYGKSGNTTVVISLDGCRWDYPLWYDTPMFDFMAENGISSGLIPSFPSKTFPNHYTLATGLYPDHHGIIANSFLDTESGEVFSLSDPEQKTNPKYYGGEPSGSQPSGRVCAQLCSIGLAPMCPFSVSTLTPILIMTTSHV